MPAEIIVVGRIAGPFGIGGEVRVSSSTHPPQNLARYRPWLLECDGVWVDAGVAEVRRHGDGFIARLRGVADREAARGLAGTEIAVPRSVLPALDPDREYYWQDLIGLTVTNHDGSPLGTVDSLLETGAHDVLVIVDGQRRTLVPFAEPFLVEVNVAAGRLTVSWQEPA